VSVLTPKKEIKNEHTIYEGNEGINFNNVTTQRLGNISLRTFL